jgi:hypothetical protein
MRNIALSVSVALAALILAQASAQASCADDLVALQARVDKATRMTPVSPGAGAAAKLLQKFNASDTQDEVDCFNTLARARHLLAEAPPAVDTRARLGQAQQPAGQAQQPQPLSPQGALDQPMEDQNKPAR